MDFETHCHLKKSVSFVLQNCDLAQRRAFRQSESLLPSPAASRSNPGHACSTGQRCELDITCKYDMYTQHSYITSQSSMLPTWIQHNLRQTSTSSLPHAVNRIHYQTLSFQVFFFYAIEYLLNESKGAFCPKLKALCE